jgi:hypothetical protein
MELSEDLEHLKKSLSVLGKRDPILQELWAIKAQINKDAQYSVEVRSKQVKGLDWAVARARVGLANIEGQ